MQNIHHPRGKRLLAMLVSMIATGVVLTASPVHAKSPPNIVTDINWSAGYNGVADIMSAFNNARRGEEMQLGLVANTLGNLVLPDQSTWNGMTDDAKALFLINAERTARANMQANVIGLPLAGVESHVDAVAQSYAQLLHDTDTTGHSRPSGTAGIDGPSKRVEQESTIGSAHRAAIQYNASPAKPTHPDGSFHYYGDTYNGQGACHEFMTRSENLAYFSASSTQALDASSILLPVERAVYAWIYDDSGSSWGHREAVLLQDTPLSDPTETWGFKNNNGASTHEGFLGFHRIGSTGYTPFGTNPGYPYNYGVAVVMNIFDPVSDAKAGSCGYNVTLRTEDLPATGGGNQAPTAAADSATTDFETDTDIAVLENDSDPDDDTLTVTSHTNPAHGSVTLNGDVFTYSPDEGYSGTDSFTYTIDDGNAHTATATVTITVKPDPTSVVDAVDDSVPTDFGKPVEFNVISNDSNPTGGALKISQNTKPPSATGSLVLSKTGTTVGQAKFTPKKGYSGTTSFTYTLLDSKGKTDTATVNITVNPGVPPVAEDDTATTKYGTSVTFNILTNDSDPKSRKLSISSNTKPAKGTVSLNKTTGVVTYKPSKGFSGTDTFNYTLSNSDGLTDSATVNITVGTNTAPTASFFAYDVGIGRARTLDKMSQHTQDVDGDAIVANSVIQKPSKGTVSIKSGKFVYTPKRGQTGEDFFSYNVKDIHGAVSNAHNIRINITATPNPSS